MGCRERSDMGYRRKSDAGSGVGSNLDSGIGGGMGSMADDQEIAEADYWGSIRKDSMASNGKRGAVTGVAGLESRSLP